MRSLCILGYSYFIPGEMVALTASTSLVPSSALLAPVRERADDGLLPSPKELSDDPEIADVLRVCKAEQAERLARMAAGEQSGTALAGRCRGRGRSGSSTRSA